MLNCNSYLRNQLSAAYRNAAKVILNGDIEREYIKMAKAGSQIAKDTLFNLYIPVVIGFARSSTYEMYNGELGDLISAAAIGFNRALELFDTTSGFEFGCFYKWHVRNAMNKEMYGDCVVHVPENLIKPQKDENGNPVVKEQVSVVSANQPVDNDSDTTLMDTLASTTSIAEDAEDADRAMVLGTLVDELPEIESDAIKRMVMDDSHVSTREWGEAHGCSHEWARRVKNKALKRLREKLSEMYCDDRMAV